MAYYLQMNGTSDKIALPSLTFDKIVIDGLFDSTQSALRYLLQTVTGTNIYARLAADDSLQLLAVTQTGFTLDTRTTVTWNTTTVPSTATLNVFTRSDGGASFAKGNLWNIKFYNGASVVAHYDMNTQTVQDQSGNGKHATLTGGTWISESSGTTHEGAASITGVSTITASATVIPAAITGSASLQGVATVSATADVVNAPMVGSAFLQGVGTAIATASIIRSGSANIIGVSTLTASAAGLAVLGGASLTGVGWVMCSAIEGQFIVSVVNLNGVQSFVIALQGSKEQTVQVLGLKDNIVLLEGEI